MASHGLQALPTGDVPEHDSAVESCGGEPLPIGADSQSHNGTGVPGEQADGVSCLDVPHADGLIGGSGKEVCGIGMKDDSVHVVQVASEDTERVDVVTAPEPGCVVVAGGGKVVSVWAKAYVPDWAVVAFVRD